MKICYAALGRAGGRYIALDPFPERQNTRKIVKADWILATRIAGHECTWPAPYESGPEPRFLEWSAPVYQMVQKLLLQGKIRSQQIRVSDGGFESLLGGVEVLRRKEVSGEKLVYRLG